MTSLLKRCEFGFIESEKFLPGIVNLVKDILSAYTQEGIMQGIMLFIYVNANKNITQQYNIVYFIFYFAF